MSRALLTVEPAEDRVQAGAWLSPELASKHHQLPPRNCWDTSWKRVYATPCREGPARGGGEGAHLQVQEDFLQQAAAALFGNRVQNPIHAWLAQRNAFFRLVLQILPF